jgi:hypothetical protein
MCVSRNVKTLGMQYLQHSNVAASSEPPDRICIIHYRTDELVERRTPYLIDSRLLLLRSGPSTPNLLAAFFPTCLTCADHVSRVPRVAPRYRAASTYSIGSPKNWTDLGFGVHLAAFPKITVMILHTLKAILQSRSQCSSLPR